ncbi:MAG: hypothetical protein AAF438_14520, partial [Pseudomonadota bacterium]
TTGTERLQPCSANVLSKRQKVKEFFIGDIRVSAPSSYRYGLQTTNGPLPRAYDNILSMSGRM